ncbi:alpha-ketoacid dehydrogenase subunit beta [Hydrogenibacillus schlegelii]|uniref:alpha-ketoacid dehydrogenase subunit beta n=1 Tax=Hydrogenibacillus schlegelii TaxID=1484 RepID=UPI0039E9DE40
MAVKADIEALREALWQAMERDPGVFVLGEDVGRRGGVFRATAGLLERFGERRVVDTPLAESAIVGVAIGAAAYGLRPVAEIQFADFIYPATNQIVNEAAKIRYRSNGAWSVPLVIRAPYGGGVHGALYHSQSVEKAFTGHPGLRVVTPSNPYDAKGLLLAAIFSDDPVLFLEHKKLYRLAKGEVPEDFYTVPLDRARTVREGDDVTVIAYGLMVPYALEAAERLAREEGIEATVLDLVTLYPLDRAAIVEAARRTGKVLIVHEDNGEGGVGGEVAAVIAETALFDLDAPIRRLTGPDVPAMPYSPPLEAWFMPSVERIAAAMRELARF